MIYFIVSTIIFFYLNWRGEERVGLGGWFGSGRSWEERRNRVLFGRGGEGGEELVERGYFWDEQTELIISDMIYVNILVHILEFYLLLFLAIFIDLFCIIIFDVLQIID